MKKSTAIISLFLSAFMLTGCANTGSGNIVSDNPFSETEQGEADNYEEAFGKYQVGSLEYSNYSIDAGTDIEYGGGAVELSFDADTSGNQYDVEIGYMAFINGIPQRLSLNGGESSELVCFSQAPNQKCTVTLSFTPVISNELSGKDILQLKLMSIFNPSYKPTGSFTGFGNAHSGQSFLEYDIKVNSPVEVSEDMAAFSECESLLITDEIAAKYGVKKPDENTPTNVFIKDAKSGEALLTLRDGKVDANLLIYGNELYNYKVYVYINHNRVKLGGYDCIETEVKSGYLNILKLDLDNIGSRDIVYAVAVPVECETGEMNVRKCGSVLVLDEKTLQENTATAQAVISKPDTTPNGFTDTDIYHYQPVGYIDDSQQYLLLTRPSFKAEDISFYDYIVYDERDGKVIGTLNAPGDFHSITYGGGVITLGIRYQFEDEHTEDIQIAVYNERLELIKEVYNSEISETYVQKYDPINDCWYFHDNEEYFCRANGDFSNIIKLIKLPNSLLRDYYITEDKIIYYKTVDNYSNPSENADLFGIMDLNGNIIEETKAAPYGAGEFRIGKAGNYIYLMSPLIIYPFDKLREPMNGVIFYNIKTKEQKTVYLEEDSENSCCMVTPDGKFLVSDILVMKDRNTCTDNIVRLYDIESGELVESKALGTDTSSGGFVYNDRLVLGIYGSEIYMFDSF